MTVARLLGLAALLAAAPLARAQAVVGTVADAAGEPFPGANVAVVGTASGAATDGRGRFRIDGLAPGTYRLRASFLGHTPHEREVEVRAGATVEVAFVLAMETVLAEIAPEATADRVRSVGRTTLPVQITPQSVSVIDAAQWEAQGAVDVESALRNVSGVVVAEREQPFATLTLRGFPADGTGSFRRNGIEIAHLADGLRANVERVEVLKGPASVLYGRLEPGGVVNFVTRQPRWGAGVRRGEVSAGAFGTGSLRGTFAPTCHGRCPAAVLDVSAERRGSFRDGVEQATAFGGGAVRQRLGQDLLITLDAEAEATRAGLDPGLALAGATLPEAFATAPYFGEPEAGYRWRSAFASATAEHFRLLGPLTNVTARVAYGGYRHDRDLITLDSLTAGGRVARSLTTDDTRYRYLYAEASASAAAITGAVRHDAVLGIEGTRLAIDVAGRAPLQADGGGFRFAAITPVALERPEPAGMPGPDELVTYATASGSGLNLGAFAQHRAQVPTPAGVLHAVASARLAHVAAGAEWFALAATPDTPAGLNERRVTVTALTPAGALLLEPAPGVSLYASYGTSFNPIFQQVDADGQPFEPTRGEQVEAGAKAERGPLALTLAAFSLHKRGALSTSPDGFYVQTGGQRSRGVELDAAFTSSRVSLLAAYALLDARVTEDEVVPVGNRLPAAPRHAGRVWGRYDFAPDATRGVAVSAGVQGVGARYATLGNELRLPAHLIVDAGLTVRASRRLAVQVNGENLLDARYFVRAVRRAGPPLVVGWPGTPRALTLRLRVDLAAP